MTIDVKVKFLPHEIYALYFQAVFFNSIRRKCDLDQYSRTYDKVNAPLTKRFCNAGEIISLAQQSYLFIGRKQGKTEKLSTLN